MSSLHGVLAPDMEPERHRHTFLLVALAAEAITSDWWVRQRARDANILNYCCKSQK